MVSFLTEDSRMQGKKIDSIDEGNLLSYNTNRTIQTGNLKDQRPRKGIRPVNDVVHREIKSAKVEVVETLSCLLAFRGFTRALVPAESRRSVCRVRASRTVICCAI